MRVFPCFLLSRHSCRDDAGLVLAVSFALPLLAFNRGQYLLSSWIVLPEYEMPWTRVGTNHSIVHCNNEPTDGGEDVHQPCNVASVRVLAEVDGNGAQCLPLAKPAEMKHQRMQLNVGQPAAPARYVG